MSGTDDGWNAAVTAWANAQRDIEALVQIGSRVQKDGVVDSWSDYDYQLITAAPAKYRSGAFLDELGSCWAKGREDSFGDVVKLTAVYEGAREADFVIVPRWEIVIATFALRWPGTEALWPRPLKAGVENLRIVAAPGWKVIKGGSLWEQRYGRLAPLRSVLSEEEFGRLCGDFWVHLVWAAKKAKRGEYLASQRTFHLYLLETCLRFAAEAALLSDRRAFPLGRRAEGWMNSDELKSLAGGTRPERDSLLAALGQLAEYFAAVSDNIAARKQWQSADFAAVRAWIAVLSHDT